MTGCLLDISGDDIAQFGDSNLRMLRMARVMLSGFRCERCGHEWVPREKDEEPRVCPRFKSPYWESTRQSEGRTRRKARKNQ